MLTRNAAPSLWVRRAALLALGAGSFAGLAGCNKGSDAAAANAKAQPAVPVDVAVARVGPVQRTVEVVGTLYGEEDATISNKVHGRVIAIYKDVGDFAAPGEPLAQLLQNDYLLTINQKRAALLESVSKLGTKDVPGEDFNVKQLPAVRKAWLQEQNAKAKYERGKQLFEKSPPLISEQDFDDLKTALDVASSATGVEVAVATGLVAEARTRLADLRVAEQALADTTIRAPRTSYPGPRVDPTTRPTPVPPAPTANPSVGPTSDDDGPAAAPAVAAAPATRPATTQATTRAPEQRYVVSARMASVGELFSAVTPMFRLVDDDPLKLRASVPERYFRNLQLGRPVKVRIDAYDKPFVGIVTRINPQVDVANRTFPIEVQIDNHDFLLPPGAFARAAIDTDLEQGVVFVPASAVVSFAGNDKVFVVKDGKAQEVSVTLGERVKDEIEVKGLKGGEQVVTSGTGRLATGMAVTPKAAAAAAPATPAPASKPATQPTP